MFIGDSSFTGGTLTLNGVIVNGVANMILHNSSSQDVTLQAAQSGAMGLVLGNATENKISLDGAGNIIITCVISGSGRALTLGGSGSGALTLSGVNTPAATPP